MQLYPHWNARDNYRYGAKKKKRKRDKSDDPGYCAANTEMNATSCIVCSLISVSAANFFIFNFIYFSVAWPDKGGAS